ncbi:hypothetical protein HHI36_014157 [Cryptolaemus montrouzieri]|uniref:Uncharacterized protein n=1 Tax=Cryptolaemus montrouzieri TaxID=559131 RepID=A0ABD2N292_9CUCU
MISELKTKHGPQTGNQDQSAAQQSSYFCVSHTLLTEDIALIQKPCVYRGKVLDKLGIISTTSKIQLTPELAHMQRKGLDFLLYIIIYITCCRDLTTMRKEEGDGLDEGIIASAYYSYESSETTQTGVAKLMTYSYIHKFSLGKCQLSSNSVHRHKQ